MSDWPKLDPITGRMICHSCWNHIHRKHNVFGELVEACDGECDCVHRSEENWAAIDPDNPLLAVNDSFKPKKKGKAHA